MSKRLQLDLNALAKELDALHQEMLQTQGAEDLAHLQKMRTWARRCTQMGYATAWLAPNPLSALLLAQANFARWAVIAHPVCHRAYDRIEETPKHLTSKHFAKGWRRFVDWFDWMLPEAWHEEHDILHHYRLGEVEDPDLVEVNLDWLRESKLPLAARLALVGFFVLLWKPLYYAPNTLKEMRGAQARRAAQTNAKTDAPPADDKEGRGDTLLRLGQWLPFTEEGRALWLQCYLPYLGWNFGATPLLFSPLGPWAVGSVFMNKVAAEALANIISFIMIVPNHVGEDIPRFEGPVRQGKKEFYLRQIMGSVNYTCGHDAIDFVHGWLNYQIEHHLFPDLPLSQYQKVQPRVREICLKYGVPYVQENVFKRVKKTIDVMVGRRSMPRVKTA